MLSWLRNNAKIFLIAIIVIFVVMIFVDWGRGRASAARSAMFVIARINGENILPEQYDAARSQVYSMLENEMQSSGDPAPENQLTTMYNEINEMAYQRMINRQLEADYLESVDWPAAGVNQADALLLNQLRLSGIPDPAQYLDRYRNDPNYNMMLYQLLVQANSRRFPSAVSIENMVSREEVEFELIQKYAPITARYIAFRTTPEVPGEEELVLFYNSNTHLFTDPPNARIRYVTLLVEPSTEDEQRVLMVVDSLALSGTVMPDSITMTREQFLAFTGWNMDLEPGEYSEPFRGSSLSIPGFPAGHSVKLVSIVPVSLEGAPAVDDTLMVLHWEVPVFPGYQTVRNTFWDVEEAIDTLLAESIPWHDSLIVADWGELYIDENTITGYDVPPALKAFALDSIWTDATGPVFYIPNFRGGYPALMVARKLSSSPGGLVSLEEVQNSGRLLIAAYSELQSEASAIAALAARDKIFNTGVSLSMYAASESLTVQTTPEFTAASIRETVLEDPQGYLGILSNPEFADAALIAPELELIGPFVSGGTAYLVEISTRHSPQLPEDPVFLAPAYLSAQQIHGMTALEQLVEELRSHSQIEDLREQYYATLDSLRAAQPETQ